jgi:hypothetical protein
MRRFTRLTNAFSKKLENHAAMLALYFMYSNVARAHQTLRVTPAMEAGIADHVWSIEEIVGLLKWGTMKNGLLLSVLFLGLLAPALLSQKLSQDHRYPVYGMGVQQCAMWFVEGSKNNANASSARNIYFVQWVAGFISGAAYASDEPMGLASSDAIIGHFLARYCPAHPNDGIDVAARALLVELKKR